MAPLPEGFLDGPAPNLKLSKVDFTKTATPSYDGLYAVVIDGVLSQGECKALIAAAEDHAGDAGWERAMVNVGGGEQKMITDIRNCGRIIWDSEELAEKIWARIKNEVPDLHSLSNWGKVTGTGPAARYETWNLTRLNERMRFLKYVGGEYFKPHCDGTYITPDGTERSYFTLHLYLNDSEAEMDQEAKAEAERNAKSAGESDPTLLPLRGGATTFHAYNFEDGFDINPKAGRVLIFQHAYLMHSGDDVVRGTKYTMRTDIMYKKDRKEDELSD
ncbi:hypothetical protein M501DRAFT_1031351 [Patellaria atrata CBS 101060]|uniref:Prolyl 4-hydroxylase alpha subunit domain-containing protein n=1 Tax=Patellaria atrata CBS 101060 TaxID=1346257 RepID=A0A9P4VPX2_9PEZI|nr:hypothetical protein M501DRAFT_1031351 [Patellaria atrata CBS 101060]